VLRGTRRASDDPGVHRACDEIERLMNELGAMVRDARIGSDRIHDILEAMGKMARAHTERRSPVALVPLVDAAVRLVSGQLRRRARLVRDYRDTPLVLGDETRLLQVFLGLLVNVTIPASPSPAGREIRVSVQGAEQSAVVELSERGDEAAESSPGPADPGVWLQEPRTDKALCLAVCRSIVVSYGGSIEVATATDAGHTVRVVLPAHMPTISR
jgi:two-component system, NtrC family, sensor kinase